MENRYVRYLLACASSENAEYRGGTLRVETGKFTSGPDLRWGARGWLTRCPSRHERAPCARRPASSSGSCSLLSLARLSLAPGRQETGPHNPRGWSALGRQHLAST